MQQKKVIVGISGASGAIYGLRCLEMLKAAGCETHAVVSRAGELTLRSECGLGLADLRPLCDALHPIGNVGASIASGSFRTAGMIIAPCSVRTLGEIVTGVTSTLLTRAADVVLKERRRLVLMVRETPLHLGHLRTMTAAAEMGAVIAPPVPAFYTNPETLEDVVRHSVGRVLDQFDLQSDIPRWDGMSPR
ncbi:UbiX family flavin prenyltransferase [Pseudodonghicola flavimaris]|uniref:Flavin prenyltransferase UbiX n=1 Tax=Pseudodonghicola flavimaris TaxID=3050036 RepID=A0ABT7F2E6_9RHOB|nr:UbiX family flavin prenyltransferase [Pseudodonghicola flavimaris]MDK3018762.1 UbiX family flavin prenyltransferase [Pseudodonghicola flavimaris]